MLESLFDKLRVLIRRTVGGSFCICMCFLLVLSEVSCSTHDDEMNEYYMDYINQHGAVFRNNMLTTDGDTLRILSLGNIFSMDMLSDVPMLAASAKIPSHSYSLYMVAKSGATLSDYASLCAKDAALRKQGQGDEGFVIYNMGGISIETIESASYSSISDLLSLPWDVIVLQQRSTLSSYFSSFTPYLPYLLLHITEICPNPNLSIYWHQTWSYPSDSGTKPSGLYGYEQICGAVARMASEFGVYNIIPVGTAVQNMRMTNITCGHELTRDGAHLDLGAGRLLAAMTFFNTVMLPYFKTDLDIIAVDDICREKNIDSETYSICLRCARDACSYPLWVTYHY